MLFWCKKNNLSKSWEIAPTKKESGKSTKKHQKNTKKKEKMFFQFFPRGWFFQNFFLVKTLLVPTFPPHLLLVVSVIFCYIFMIFCRFRRFWSSGVGFQAKKWLFFASIMVWTTIHNFLNHNMAENMVESPKSSKSQEFTSHFWAGENGFTG